MLYLSLGSNSVLDGMAHEGPEARGVMYLICFATIYIRCLRNLQIQIHGWKKKRRSSFRLSLLTTLISYVSFRATKEQQLVQDANLLQHSQFPTSNCVKFDGVLRSSLGLGPGRPGPWSLGDPSYPLNATQE